VSSGQGPTSGFNYGGGVKVKLTNLFGFRVTCVSTRPASLRPRRRGLLHQTEISAGVSIRL